MEKQYNLEPVWRAIMDIYVEFERVCKKYGLRYYVACGTAIGIERHHGFIPWDDDFDLFMPRPDYNKLTEIIEDELPKNLIFLSRLKNKAYRHVFNKVKNQDEFLLRKVQEESGLCLDEGIYIDIFPIDGAPNTWFGQQFYWLKRMCLRSVGVFYRYRNEGPIPYRHIPLYFLGMFFSLFYPNVKKSDDMCDEIAKWASSYPYKEENCSVCCETDVKFIIPREGLGRPVMKEFMYGFWLPVPAKNHEILVRQYGDYMTPPPVNEQVPRHQKFIGKS